MCVDFYLGKTQAKPEPQGVLIGVASMSLALAKPTVGTASLQENRK